MKKTIILVLITAIILASMPINAYAVGSATINFKSNNTVFIGDTIKVYVSIENIEDANNGIVGIEGKLIFDNKKLEFIEAKTIDTPYDIWFNPKLNKLVGIDFTFEKAINKNTNIYEFTFKALEEGATNITLGEAELSDSKANILNTNVYSKDIIITKKVIKQKEEEKVEEVFTPAPVITKEAIKTEVKEEITNKEKLEKVNNAVHSLLKKITDLF